MKVLTILDKYILKRYLATFTVMLLLFIPVGIVIDVAEKVNKMLENKVALLDIAEYYVHFVVYFANILFPIFLFLSIIWFTSKMANNTEIIAILSSGISFTRFLRPYIIGATMVCVFVFFMGFYVVPVSSEKFNNFRYTYLRAGGKELMKGKSTDIFRQINEHDFIYVSSFNPELKSAYDFILERFNGEKLEYKITANRIQWNEKEKNYTFYNYTKRTVGELGDKIEKVSEKKMAMKLNFDDLAPVIYIAETLSLTELNNYIDKEKRRGSSNINMYLVVWYKKFSVPISAFILTIIAVAVSAMKRRGGMGMNLAIGIAIAFGFVFFDKIFGVLAEKSNFSPIIAVWLPNFIFGILALFLLNKARR